MNITIIGAGNIGCALAVRFSQNPKNKIILYSHSKSNAISKNIVMHTDNGDLIGSIYKITSNLKYAIKSSNYIFITYPAFLFKQLANKMNKYLNKNRILIFYPGSGGAEIFFNNAINRGIKIIGFQRVHAVCRLIKNGLEVKESGVREKLYVASIPHKIDVKHIKFLKKIFNMNIEYMPNYLNITLINSNAILHTSRLYCLFKDYKVKKNFYDKVPLFYEDWDVESSKLLIKMDNELFDLINHLNKKGYKVNKIKRILDHYESKNEIELTNKIRSIKSFKGLTTPIVKTKNGFIPDFNSRYFVSDFNYGLDILIMFCNYYDIKCEIMNTIVKWYHLFASSKRISKLDSKIYKR